MVLMDKLIYYLSDQFWNEIGDPRINDWPLVYGGLWRILVIISFYLILTRILLPKYMENRKPYKLKKLILAYNTFMVVTNFVFFCITVANIDCGKIFLNFSYPSHDDRSPHTMWLLSLGWYGYLTRIIDLLDTVFFVLRKNDRQVTVLHVYHHSMVPILGWIAGKLNGMVPAMRLFILMNTFIHSLMYGYYTLAALGPSVQKYLWWKKYITILQLAQFVILGVYGIVGYLLQTGYPIEIYPAFVIQPPIFFLMFYNFYRQTYDNSKQKTKRIKII